jgi:glycine C-acetyltransferase
MATSFTKDDAMRAKQSGALKRSLADYVRPKGRDLLKRTEAFFDWQDTRRKIHLWPYARSLDAAPETETSIQYDDGHNSRGLNFASQDYLSLARHPAIAEVARKALADFGPHSAGSPVLLGNTSLSLRLEREIGEALQMDHVMLFPTGWAAGFGSIVGLARPYDYIVMDELAHACLQQGANAATPNVMRHKHLAVDQVRSQLQHIRSQEPDAGVMVITEGLFSMDSDMPDLIRLQESCSEYDARLLVDIAHDFGSLGPSGTGWIGCQKMLGKIDLVMGSFSKTFASNGGFLASHSEAVKQFVKYFGGPHTFSNALSPIQAAVVSKALSIVRSSEGDSLRSQLGNAVACLRNSFATSRIQCIGEPSAIVPVPIGSEAIARLSSALLYDKGVLVNVVEFPAVAVGASRFRMQVMAAHSEVQATKAAQVIVETLKEAASLVESIP